MIDYVDAILTNWGDFMKSVSVNPIGHRTETVENTMREIGAVLNNRDPRANTDYPEDVQKTERAILKMPRDLQAVVIVQYTQGGGWQRKARILGLNRIKFFKQIDSAHFWLAGYFDSGADVMPRFAPAFAKTV